MPDNEAVVTLTRRTSVELYAGFWKRAAASVIDAIVLGVVMGPLLAVTAGLATPAILLLPWVYEAWMHSSEWQATLGKRAMNIMVTGPNGGRISFPQATGRHFAKYLSAILLAIGFMMAGFTKRKQALHDMLAETLVINKED